MKRRNFLKMVFAALPVSLLAKQEKEVIVDCVGENETYYFDYEGDRWNEQILKETIIRFNKEHKEHKVNIDPFKIGFIKID